MKRDFIVSKIEAPQDGSRITFTDPNEPKSSGEAGSDYPQRPFGKSGEVIPFTSPEDIMKNLPKAMSNMFGTVQVEDCLEILRLLK
jgi:hypothetical protein